MRFALMVAVCLVGFLGPASPVDTTGPLRTTTTVATERPPGDPIAPPAPTPFHERIGGGATCCYAG